MAIKEFLLDRQTGDVSFVMSDGSVESFNLSEANDGGTASVAVENKIFGQVMPLGRLASGAISANSTWRIAQTIPKHFKRVRCHMFNVDTVNAVTGAKAQISLSESFANGSRPTLGGVLSNSGWTQFLFGGVGTVNIPAGAFSIATSDWLDLNSQSITGSLEYPIVYADRYIPTGNTAQVGYSSPTANWVPFVNGLTGTKHQAFIYNQTIDAVASPASFTATAGGNLNIPMLLEFEFINGTATLMCFGDSTKEGTGNVNNTTPVGPAVMVQAKLDVAGKPFSAATFAHGGTTAASNYTKVVAMLAVTRPTVLYFQPYSVNDTSDYAGSASAALTRAQQVVDLCNSKQIKLVLETPLPIWQKTAAAITAAELNALRTMETGLLQFASSTVKVLDMRSLHNPTKPGVWAEAFGYDSYHPNTDGYVEQTQKLFDVLITFI